MMKSVVGNLSGEYATILEKAIDGYGLPWDAPVEPHIVDGDAYISSRYFLRDFGEEEYRRVRSLVEEVMENLG